MTFGEKLRQLRKREGMSQEELAGRLNVSRQAISRWENEGILPDAGNLIQLNRLFGVSVDYLLHDEYDAEDDLPAVQRAQDNLRCRQNQQAGFVCSVGLLVLALLIQLTGWWYLQNMLAVVGGMMIQIAAIVGFEAGWRWWAGKRDPAEEAIRLRQNFYLTAVWLAAYTPIRILGTMAWGIWPKPYATLWMDVSIIVVYFVVCLVITVMGKKLSSPQ